MVACISQLSVALLILTFISGSSSAKAPPVVKAVTPPVSLGEGPHWDSETGVLFFVDISGQLVIKYDPASDKVTQAKFPGGGVSLVIPVKGTSTQKLLLSRGHDILVVDWNQENAVFDNNSDNITVLATIETEPEKSGNRWNDGKADARGRLWAGTMGAQPRVDYVVPEQGGLYHMDAENDFTPVLDVPAISISNGIAWNKDNTLFYYIDSNSYQVDVFDFDLEKGIISNRCKVFNFTENGISGFPVGMTVDNNGNLWVADYGGYQVINVNPVSGELIQIIPFPVKYVTSVAFGGANLDTLYVTTSRYLLTDEELKQQPLAGCTFSVTGLGVTAAAVANNVVVPVETS